MLQILHRNIDRLQKWKDTEIINFAKRAKGTAVRTPDWSEILQLPKSAIHMWKELACVSMLKSGDDYFYAINGKDDVPAHVDQGNKIKTIELIEKKIKELGSNANPVRCRLKDDVRYYFKCNPFFSYLSKTLKRYSWRRLKGIGESLLAQRGKSWCVTFLGKFSLLWSLVHCVNEVRQGKMGFSYMESRLISCHIIQMPLKSYMWRSMSEDTLFSCECFWRYFQVAV